MSLVKRDQNTARRKGIVAGMATVGSVALLAAGAWPLAIVGAASAALLAVDWFRYRAERGMRF
jgi:hypothetical protein